MFEEGERFTFTLSNPSGQVISIPVARYRLEYDANGNVLEDGQNTYVFDAANRLTQAQNKPKQIPAAIDRARIDAIAKVQKAESI